MLIQPKIFYIFGGPCQLSLATKFLGSDFLSSFRIKKPHVDPVVTNSYAKYLYYFSYNYSLGSHHVRDGYPPDII